MDGGGGVVLVMGHHRDKKKNSRIAIQRPRSNAMAPIREESVLLAVLSSR
jgi:hypothetical protein